MRAIVKLYLNYLELTLIGMLVAALAITLVAGILATRDQGGDIALIPALLANTTLILMGFVAFDRRKLLGQHPEIKTKPFKEFRLFMLTRRNKAVLVTVLVLVTLGTTYSTDQLLINQAIVAAGMGVPATFFNRTLVIDVLEISAKNDGTPPKVTALLHADGYPEMKIEQQGVGYQTTYTGSYRFNVRIVEVTDVYAKFFVERIIDQ